MWCLQSSAVLNCWKCYSSQFAQPCAKSTFTLRQWLKQIICNLPFVRLCQRTLYRVMTWNTVPFNCVDKTKSKQNKLDNWKKNELKTYVTKSLSFSFRVIKKEKGRKMIRNQVTVNNSLIEYVLNFILGTGFLVFYLSKYSKLAIFSLNFFLYICAVIFVFVL